MRILVSGSTGLIGSALVPFLTSAGHEVTRLVRRTPQAGEKAVQWDPARASVEPSALEGFDAVVHLAGENIASGRWTAAKRVRIRASRVETTEFLCQTLALLRQPPRVIVCASGTGYYGEGGERPLTEDSPPGRGFFVDLVRDWESACDAATAAGIRVVNARIGTVVTPAGGAVGKALPAFRFGFGVIIGSGRSHTGWISLDDLLRAIYHALITPTLAGPVNMVAPRPVSQREFAQTLGRALGRPAWLKVPALALRWMFSPELAEAMLWDQRLVPKRLLESGFDFRHVELEATLRHLLGQDAAVRAF